MSIGNDRYWNALEAWGPTLFAVGFALELVFAVNHGAAYLSESIEFFGWIYPSVIVGRFAVLLGLAGLSVSLVDEHPRLARGGRVLLGTAMVFSLGLIATSILDNVGLETPIIAVFGIGTVAFTFLSFLTFGIAGLRTDAYPSAVGGLLLVSCLALLFVLLGSGTFSTNVRGAVGEGVNAVVFLAISYLLRGASGAAGISDGVTDTAAE